MYNIDTLPRGIFKFTPLDCETQSYVLAHLGQALGKLSVEILTDVCNDVIHIEIPPIKDKDGNPIIIVTPLPEVVERM